MPQCDVGVASKVFIKIKKETNKLHWGRFESNDLRKVFFENCGKLIGVTLALHFASKPSKVIIKITLEANKS